MGLYTRQNKQQKQKTIHRKKPPSLTSSIKAFTDA